MAGKTAEQLLHEFRGNSAADVTMSLLRSRHALLNTALMAAHLGDGQVVDGQTLAALIDADLPALLRGYVWDDESEEAVPDADYLLNRWTRRGWLHRTVDPETRVERYQLSTGAHQAVRQMRNLQRHSSLATESALTMLMDEIRQIATDADPDPRARRDAIDDRIAALVAQRDALDRGELPTVSNRELVDRLTAVVQLVERIPADVARYGELMHDNAATLLRQSLTDDPAEFADSLQRMFDGHDVIAESAEGQAFRAFATVIARPSQRTRLEADIAAVVERLDPLPGHLAEALEGFIDAVWQRVQEVEEIRAVAFRRISTFVRGGDVLHYRSMRLRISEAQAAAAEAFGKLHGGRDIGFVLPTGGVEVASVGRLRLHPGTASLPDPLASSADDDFAVDVAAAAGTESIDWAALRTAVNASLRDGPATLADVLLRLPSARTGDVLALWSLASRYGEVDPGAVETVGVRTRTGGRALTVPRLVFGAPIPDVGKPHRPATGGNLLEELHDVRTL
ncbi:hypothetical protein Val02_52760 [Virgisporangium aliadipatigenens]|uniref:DUF3375 domain-containing protein n=1 Tax=Virgisporangium aliadipatigenens TaxID=741659 RepID=A0A8J3YQZ9_9ACTN|nr:DUF3375 family protein [Virgisporangium aliadipatigenens]GIJ48390.1 hypothetical protein Val02_52760 [Virgisporangium aliadipatigenens]